MKLLAILGLLFLAACAHQLELYPRGQGATGTGVANESGKTITISLNGKTYLGNYVYAGDAASLGLVTTSGSPALATAVGTGGGTAGRILARADDGDSIRCEFLYADGGGLGVCEDNQGIKYDLVIK